MDEKEARKIAKNIVKTLFTDNYSNRKVERLMLVFKGESFSNPGWGDTPIEDIITEQILKGDNNANIKK